MGLNLSNNKISGHNSEINNFRLFIIRNLVAFVFLISYFITIVLGNLLFETNFSRDYITQSGYQSIYFFDTTYDAGYWILLLSPFLSVPLMVFFIKRTGLSSLIKRLGRSKEINRNNYLLVQVFFYGYIAVAFFLAGAWSLLFDSQSALAAVESRFLLRERLGLGPLVVIMSILPFFSIYGFVRSLRESDPFWKRINLINIVALSFFYFLLNMKWPILVYYIGLFLVYFVYSPRKILGKLIMALLIVAFVFLIIASFVFRLEADSNGESGLIGAAFSNVEFLFVSSINRMSVIFPYYYNVGSLEFNPCNGVIEQLQFGASCRPSTYVYTEIFGLDGFEGRGTAPQPAHITGYVLGGWTWAFLFLLSMSFIIALLECIPFYMSSLSGALGIYAALVGYHLSQVPIEGPFIYDHGFLWVMFLLWFLYIFKKIKLPPIGTNRR